MKNLAVALLALAAVRHYGWHVVPPEYAGIASKGLTALVMLALVGLLWRLTRGGYLLGAVLAWWAWEESQVAICSALFAINPWPVQTGQGICSALTGLDLGAVGICIVALLAWQAIKSDGSNQL